VSPYYEHAGITIYHGDCREILPSLPKVDAVITDPPYGIAWSRGINNARSSKAHAGIKGDVDTSCRDEAFSLITCPAIAFGSFYAPFPRDTKQVLIWAKPNDAGVVGSTTGFRRDAEPIFLIGDWETRKVERSSVLRSCHEGISAIATETGHPHTKPLDLIESLIYWSNAQTILDPFMGSGTTLVAAKNLGRKAIGIEIEEKYCEIAAKRLSQEVFDFPAA